MIATDSNIDQIIKDNPVVLIEFWADWCTPCLRMSPILDEIENENNLPIFRLNVDENKMSAQKFSVSSIPNMILFENGAIVKTITGARPKHFVLKELEEWI